MAPIRAGDETGSVVGIDSRLPIGGAGRCLNKKRCAGPAGFRLKFLPRAPMMTRDTMSIGGLGEAFVPKC